MEKNSVQSGDCSQKNKTTSGFNTRTIVLAAAFVALATVTNAFITVRIGSLFKISALLIVCFYAGYYLGAPLGFLVGIISDIFGLLLFSDGALNPLILLSSGLNCALPALFFGLKRPLKNKPTFGEFAIKSALGYFTCYILCTVLISSVGIWLYTSYIVEKYQTLIAGIGYRAAVQSLNTVANYAATLVLFIPLSKIKTLDRG